MRTLPLTSVGRGTEQPNSEQFPIRMSWAPVETKVPVTVAPTRVIDAPVPTTTFPFTVELKITHVAPGGTRTLSFTVVLLMLDVQFTLAHAGGAPTATTSPPENNAIAATSDLTKSLRMIRLSPSPATWPAEDRTLPSSLVARPVRGPDAHLADVPQCMPRCGNR